jgi:Xaa-Pro aminopeptidase
MMPNRYSNLEALKKEMAASDLDALVAISPENVTYATGSVIWTQRSLRDRLAMAVWPRGGEPTFLVAGQEAAYAKEQSWIKDIRSYVAHGDSPIGSLASALREKGLGAGRIGIELSYLSAAYQQELATAMPELQLVSCESLFHRARLVKTPGEVELLSKAAVATERALLATYATIQPGDRERALVGRLAENMLTAGADAPSFLYLAVGPNTGYAHPSPTDYAAQPGDLVKTDCGAFFSGYQSDIARTAVIGKASPEQRSIYERLVQVHARTIESMKPGVAAREVFRVAVEEYKRVNIPFSLAFAGHGLGLSGHEDLLLSADEGASLAPNMVFAVETRVRWPGKAGYHIEDLVVIEERGPKKVTTFMDTGELMEL